MIKWFAYIVLLLLLTPCLSFAKKGNIPPFSDKIELVVANNAADTASAKKPAADDDKKKIKEITKARRQPKPEKIDANGSTAASKKAKTKPKRQRRPEGLERPPEIPRRDGD
jgi:hypothetical protein